MNIATISEKAANFQTVGANWRRRFTGILLTTLTLFVAASSVQGQVTGLKVSGDFRLRFESTSKQQPTDTPGVLDPRYREVVRFRASATSQINDMVTFGARLATGSADDPNTADVTLGDFVNDLGVSLDEVFLNFKYQGLAISGGKISNPFLKTDLVWDGDVNPQGVAASYTVPGNGKISPKFVGMYSVIDEQTVNPDSYMWGGQVQLGIHSNSDWGLTLAGGFYDYTIKSLANADAGDTRSNFLTTVTTSTQSAVDAYLSDFNLFDAIAIVEYRGLGERTPIRFIGDFVKNTGANVDEDKGFMLDLFVGQVSSKKDLRFRYGYSKLETDGVLAAFSNDNTTIPSNYQQHTVTAEYVVLDNTTLDLTWYYFRRNKVAADEENDFISRLRLNAIVKF